MVAVNVVDGVKYGFRLLGYLLAVAIVGVVLLAIAGSFAPGPFGQGNPILALIFGIAGFAVIAAGQLGLLYKVIADGVEVGSLSAEQGGGLGEMGGGSGLVGGGGQPGQQRRAAGGPANQQQQQGRPQPHRGAPGGNQSAQGGHRQAQGHDTQGQQPPGDWEPGS